MESISRGASLVQAALAFAIQPLTNAQTRRQFSAAHIERHLSDRERATNFLEPMSKYNFRSVMDYDQRDIIIFIHNKGVQPGYVHARLKAQFADDPSNLGGAQIWRQYIRQARMSAGWGTIGKAFLGFIDPKSIACFNRKQFHSAYSMVETIGFSYSTILRQLQNVFGMKNFGLRQIPHKFTEDLRQRHVAVCEDLLPMLEAQERNNSAIWTLAIKAGSSWNTWMRCNGACPAKKSRRKCNREFRC